MLTFLGIGLIALSLSAFRSANSDPGESADQAFLKALEESTTRFFKLLCLPYEFVVACRDALINLFLFPFRLISKGFSRTSEAAQTLIEYVHTWILWLFNLPGDFFSTIYARLGDMTQYFASILLIRFDGAKTTVTKSSVGVFLTESTENVSWFLYRTKIGWFRINKGLSDMAISVEEFGVSHFKTIRRARDNNIRVWRDQWNVTNRNAIEGWVATQSWTVKTKDLITRDYNSLNRALSRWAVSVEAKIERLSTTVRSLTKK